MQKLDRLLGPRTASTGEGQALPTELTPDSVACEVCGDAGFVRRELPLGHPDFGRAAPCDVCNPVPIAWGIPDRLVLATFDAFALALNPGMKAAQEACQAVAAGERWCALLMGDIGVGKSHLAAAALYASKHEKPGRFWGFARLLLHMRRQAFDDSGPRWSEEYVLRPFTEGRALLVLDDVGAEKLTEWANQTLYTVLNARYEASLPTIVTTNKPDAIDNRVLSRYFEGTVSCRGQDVRRLKTGA